MAKAYKLFRFMTGDDGYEHLYPPIVPNPDGAPTPTGKWVEASAPKLVGYTKTGRPQVQAGGKGTGHSKMVLAYRPGWHLAELPYAPQFLRKDGTLDAQLVWCEVEYSDEIDYQKQAYEAGLSENGKYRHAYAGLQYVPKRGCYRYRTNPKQDTVEWIIAGSIKVLRYVPHHEVVRILAKHGIQAPERR